MHYTITTHGDCTLARSGDHYTMTGPTGEHRLLVSSTDPDRLAAHWAEFSGQMVRAMSFLLVLARREWDSGNPYYTQLVLGVAQTVEQAEKICADYRSVEALGDETSGALIEWKQTDRGIKVIAHQDTIVPIN